MKFKERAEAFKSLSERERAAYPEVRRATKRAEQVSNVLKAADAISVVLADLAETSVTRTGEPHPRTIDPPIAALRDFRRQTLDRLCRSLPTGAHHPRLAELQAALAQPVAPGRELVSACEDIVSVLQGYLWMLLEQEAAGLCSLPEEDIDDWVEDAARAELPDTRNQTLARLKVAAEENNYGDDFKRVQAVRKQIERRRKTMASLASTHWQRFKREALAEIDYFLARCEPDSADAVELRALAARLDDVDDREVRLAFKRWLFLDRTRGPTGSLSPPLGQVSDRNSARSDPRDRECPRSGVKSKRAARHRPSTRANSYPSRAD